VFREGKMVTLTTTIAEAPAELSVARAPQKAPTPKPPGPTPPADLHPLAAVQVSEIPATLRDALLPDVAGVAVVQIQPSSPVADRLRVGDVIEEINRRPVRTVEEFERAAQALGRDDKALLLLCRGRSRAFVVVP
jgi:serine protease Do